MSVVASSVLAALGAGLRRLAGPLLPPMVEALVHPLEQTASLVRPPVDGRPGPAIVDLAVSPFPRQLGQLVGVNVPPGLSVESARAYVAGRGVSQRGRPVAIVAAVRAALGNPNATVKITERDGSAYRFTVTTYAAETPDPSVVPPAIASEKAMGMRFTHVVASGVTWDQLEREPEAAALMWDNDVTWEQLGLLVPDEK